MSGHSPPSMSRDQEIQHVIDGWADSGFANTPEGALQYLKFRMFVKRDMKPLKPKGSWIRQTACMYWQHRNGIIDVMPNELRSLAKLQGISVDTEALKQAKKRHEENVCRTREMPHYINHPPQPS